MVALVVSNVFVTHQTFTTGCKKGIETGGQIGRLTDFLNHLSIAASVSISTLLESENSIYNNRDDH
jgi:hypothetical protein